MNRTIGYRGGKRAQDSNEVFCEVQHKKTTNASIDFSESHEIGLPNSSACDENARHANVLGKAASKISEANTPKKQISNRRSRSRNSEPRIEKKHMSSEPVGPILVEVALVYTRRMGFSVCSAIPIEIRRSTEPVSEY